MKDMTEGKPLKLIIGFAIPMLIGNLFQQIYSIIDTIIVGRYLGEEALAGVGNTGSLSNFLLALIFGLCSGAGLIAAQCFGCKNRERLQQTVTAMIWSVGVLTAVISVLGVCAAEFFLQLLGVPENVIGYSTEYLRIIYGFCFANIIYNGASAILRSLGDSKTPLYALIAASLTNAVLDIFFITVCGLGVAGAAYATIAAQLLSAVITTTALYRKRAALGLSGMRFRPKKSAVLQIAGTGFPMAFQSCVISLGSMSIQSLINSYGSAVMAAYAAASRIDSMAIQVIISLGTSLSVFTGQNIGKNRIDRVKRGLYETMAVTVSASLLIAVFVLCFRGQLMRLFLDSEVSAESISVGEAYLSIIGVAYVIAAVMQSYQNVIRGTGDVNNGVAAGLSELTGKIVFAYLLSSLIGINGIWIATPLSWACGCVIPTVRYYSGKWKNKRLV